MTHRMLHIKGMTCAHCVAAVRRELASVPGVRIGAVAIATADVDVDEAAVSDADLRRAVEKAGYELERIH